MRKYSIEFFRSRIVRDEWVITYHLVTRIYNNYRHADNEFIRIAKLYNENVLLSYSDNFNAFEVARKWRTEG